jgi:hypothetical protein
MYLAMRIKATVQMSVHRMSPIPGFMVVGLK